MSRRQFDALRLDLADGERVHVYGRPELFERRGTASSRRGPNLRAGSKLGLKTPASPRGSSFSGFRISSFVNPAVTSPACARAAHHDPLATGSFPRFDSELRVIRPSWRTAGAGGAGTGRTVGPARLSFSVAGGTSVRSPRCWTRLNSQAGSSFASGLNFKTTSWPSRSTDSRPQPVGQEPDGRVFGQIQHRFRRRRRSGRAPRR